MAIGGRFVSLAHLCMMEVAPVDLVRAASSAGYDGVGIRLVPTSDGIDHQVLGNPVRMSQLRRTLDDTGISVLDIEVVRLRPDGPGEVRPLLEAGQALGARHVICTVEDPVPVRRVEALASFAALAAEHGLRATLEYMVFSSCAKLAEALSLVEQVGGSGIACVLVDPLHHERAGGRPDEVAGLPLDLAPYIQLCDTQPAGPAADPASARAEAVHGRLLPGDGALPLRDLLAHLHPGAGISVESPLAGERRPDDPAAWAARALAATRAVLTG
jgi:sugar phosphate isomerase/epimerase